MSVHEGIFSYFKDAVDEMMRARTLCAKANAWYEFFFMQTDRMGIRKKNANHLLRTFRAFLEGFILLEAHNSFGNPISIEKSFDVSLKVLIEGIKMFCSL